MKLLLIILPHWPLQVRKFLLHFYFFIWLMDVLSLTFRTVSYHHPHQDLLTEWLSPSGFHLLWNLLSYIFFFFPLRSTVLPPFCLSSTIRISFFFSKNIPMSSSSVSLSLQHFSTHPKRISHLFLPKWGSKWVRVGGYKYNCCYFKQSTSNKDLFITLGRCLKFHKIGQRLNIKMDRNHT